MDKILIRGGLPLAGAIPIAGAKNAALPLMAACLLTDETLVLGNLPELADIKTMADLLAQHGVAIAPCGAEAGMPPRVLELSAREITSTTAPYDLVRKMRASFLVLGPLVARCGEARVSLPGGDEIGVRPVDLHIKGLQRLGAEVELAGGYIEARAPNGLKGAEIVFPSVSVGATEHLLMAAALAEGESVLINAAREPEIVDLASCLNAMGARIEGIGSDRLIVRGVAKLHGARHTVIPDRIETGTYLMAVAAAGGEVLLGGARIDHIEAVVRALGKRRYPHPRGRGRPARAAQHRADRRGRRDDRAVSRIPDRSAGAGDGADDDRRWRGDDHRDDLREPLHARAGTDAPGRQHPRAGAFGAGARGEAAGRRRGHGDRPSSLGLAGHRRARRRGRHA